MASPLPTHTRTLNRHRAIESVNSWHAQPSSGTIDSRLTNNQNQSNAADSGQPDNFFGQDHVSADDNKKHVTEKPDGRNSAKQNNKHKFGDQTTQIIKQ
jgi:hypothetical protein